MEKVRAFIAIELPETLKVEIAGLQQRLKTRSNVPVRWVNPGNIHLTLKFLGDINNDSINEILNAMGQSVHGFKSFNIGVKGLGAFPNSQRTRVIWVGLTGNLEKLKNLQQNIDNALDRLGFPRETRPFSPHLTIARLQDRASSSDRRETGQLIESISFIPSTDIRAEKVYLIKSQLTREGPIYNHLGSVNLD